MKTPRDLSGSELISSLSIFGYGRVRQTGSYVQLVTQRNGEQI
jgi:predicted RNA binding protein YcfA (HicA-like mRNA interferase family)